MAVSIRQPRENIAGYQLDDGRVLYLLGGGNLVNIACADGHPADIMDISFALQTLSALWALEQKRPLPAEVIAVPREIDQTVAYRKLKSYGVAIDQLSEKQERYLSGWKTI